MNPAAAPTDAVAPPPGEPIWFLANLGTVLVRGEQTGGRLCMLEMAAPPGDQPPLHLHRHEDEGFYVLEGEVTVWIGDRVMRLGPGDFALAPRDVPHTYLVTSDRPARWLVTGSPAGFERFVTGYGEPAPERRLPDPRPPDVERLGRLAAEHGIEILGPPGARP